VVGRRTRGDLGGRSEDRSDRIYASGLRNAGGLALEPTTGALWASVNERDEIGSDRMSMVSHSIASKNSVLGLCESDRIGRIAMQGCKSVLKSTKLQ